jgi:hypothetical protein
MQEKQQFHAKSQKLLEKMPNSRARKMKNRICLFMSLDVVVAYCSLSNIRNGTPMNPG